MNAWMQEGMHRIHVRRMHACAYTDVPDIICIHACVRVCVRACMGALRYVIIVAMARLGWGHTRILYKAPEDYAKPQNTIQNPDRLYKAP